MSTPLAEVAYPRMRRTSGLGTGAARCSILVATLLPMLLATIVFGLYFQAQPHWLADPDAQDYAQAGRQLAAGRGPTTRFMPWNGLDYLVQRGSTTLDAGGSAAWPNIVRFPLTPLLMALGFLAFGPGDEAVHLPAGLAFVVTAGCVGLLGARVYGTWAGLTAGLAAACLPLLVNYSLTGLTEPLLGLLIVGVLACVLPPLRAGEAVGIEGMSAQPIFAPRMGHGRVMGRGGEVILGGVLFGLAVLNRYDTALLAIPILALWLLPRPDRLRASTRFLIPAVVVVLPWALYLTTVAGTPLFNLQPASIAAQASGRADGLGWYLPEYVPPAEVWARDPTRALRLAWGELADTPNHLRKLLGWPWLIAGAAACLLALARLAPRVSTRPRVEDPFPDPAPRKRAEWRSNREGIRLVVFLLVAVLLRAALASTLGLNLQRHFVPLVPLLLVIVAGEALWLVQALIGRVGKGTQTDRALLAPAQAVVALLLIVPGLWVIWPFLIPPSQPPGPPTRTGEVEARPENLARIAELVGPGQVVASNVPWSVAWQADRRAVPLPPSVEATPDLERRFGISVDAIYLAGQVAIADTPRSWRAWDELRRRGAPPPGYVLADSFANGGRLFVKAR